MKKYNYIYIFLLIAALCSCNKDINSKFDIEPQSGQYSDSTIFFTGERQTVNVAILPTEKTSSINLSSPTNDSWFTAFHSENNLLTISVSKNASAAPRESYLLFKCGNTTKKIKIVQDYYKYLEFYSQEAVIDPIAGRYDIPVFTNVDNGLISCVVNEGSEWISGFSLVNNTLSIDVSRNGSKEMERGGKITLSYEGKSSTIDIVQAAMVGTPYIVSLDGLSFDKYPVYEIWDDENSVKVGEICKEYLYKYNSNTNELIVDESFLVAYPIYQEKMNYTKGLVLDNGGVVSWNTSISASTPGFDYISSYSSGTLTSVPMEINLPAGATSFRYEPMSGDEEQYAVRAVCRPMLLQDTRSGEANTNGETEESYTYPVVKIALQYWITQNLKTSRFANGSNIPTGLANSAWAAIVKPIHKPACSISGTSPSDTYTDANDPKGAATRNQYGCLYNYAAIVNQEIDVSGTSASSFSKVDRISPKGWKVPTKDQFTILYSYVCQKQYDSYNVETAEIIPKFSADGNNITGFSANGSRERGLTGGYNPILYYSTIDYSYEGATHGAYQLRLRSGNYSSMFLLALGNGTCIRLIKENK